MTNELTLENIRSGAFPSDAHAVGFLLGELERLAKERAAAIDRLTPMGLQVERLRAALGDVLKETYADAALTRKLHGIANEALGNALEPCEQRARPLEAETRAATSRKVPSTEDAGRPPPTEGASRDAPGVVQRVCHALTDNCVMFTDPERPPCTPENCKAVKASRDASSTCPSIHDHMWRPAQHGEYCIRCNAQRT